MVMKQNTERSFCSKITETPNWISLGSFEVASTFHPLQPFRILIDNSHLDFLTLWKPLRLEVFEVFDTVVASPVEGMWKDQGE